MWMGLIEKSLSRPRVAGNQDKVMAGGTPANPAALVIFCNGVVA
jgi:hypothetical protein